MALFCSRDQDYRKLIEQCHVQEDYFKKQDVTSLRAPNCIVHVKSSQCTPFETSEKKVPPPEANELLNSCIYTEPSELSSEFSNRFGKEL